MKKRALWQDIFREIWRTKARFLSIFSIIMLGVGFFAGIKATGPDMLDTAAHYYRDQQLMDVKVMSTYGLNKKDMEILHAMPEVSKIQPGYSADAFLGDTGVIAKVLSYGSEDLLNQYVVVEGRLPEASGEMVVDASERGQRFKVGDTIALTNPDPDAKLGDTFRTLEYKIVGKVKSPQFISSMGRGTSRIGKGTADVFAVIPDQDFKLSVYTEAYLTFKDTASLTPYTALYDERVEKHMEAIEQAFAPRPEERLEEVKAEGQQKLDDAKVKVAEGKQQLQEAGDKLKDAKAQLDEGEQSYQDGKNQLESELAKGQAQLNQAKRELDQGKAQLTANRTKLTEGQAQLEKGEQQLATQKQQLEPKLAAGKQLAQSLIQVAALPPDAIPEEQRQSLISGAEAADSKLGQVVAGYMAGSVDGDTLKQAADQFEQGLKQAASKLHAAEQELNKQKQELNAGLSQLKAAEQKLASGEAEWKQGTKDLAAAKQEGEAKLAEAKADLDKGRADYEDGLKTYEEEKAKAERDIADGEREIADGQKELDKLELPKVFVFDRSVNPGYTEYSDNADRLASIATAFPVFFFLIAALVSLTTMTRMVEEQRLQIGTMKALGYSNRDIMKKFFVYASLASVSAAAAGLAIGYTFFPRIIYDAYGTLYNLPAVRTNFYMSYSLISLGVAVLCTTLTAMVATRVELKSNASVLMRPRAPKSGSRIMLERIGFIWNQLSFTGKVTARNLFRYKQRMFMTVCGVAGCTALILTGFGLKDSIGDIAPLQYGKIMKYQAAVVFQDDSSKQVVDEYNELIAGTPEVTASLNVAQEAMTAVEKGVNNQDVHLFVPESDQNLSEFVVIKGRKQTEPVKLPDEGVVVTEKLAKLFDLEKGSTLTLQNNNGESFELTVAGMTENYAMHYVYMKPDYYKQVFGAEAKLNTQLLNFGQVDQAWEDQFGEQLHANKRVAMVSFTSGVSDAFNDTMDSMNVVVVVLIISAAALAFVVLYNLTNINVSERIRELSTIKVLGFYDKEVTMYIYRENMILTVLGILVGSFLGIVLHRFVLDTAELDAMMFSPTIHGSSYVYAGLLTLLFSGVVMASMHLKLKKIDMIEALKSVE